MFSCHMPCFHALIYLFLVLLFRSTCLHAWYHIFGHALLRSTCLHACFYAYMSKSMFSHACMLGFAFSRAFMHISTCLDVYPHAYMRIPMLICVDRCVYMFRSMLSTCLILSSMCLCAPCHVCLPKARLCLSWSCAIVALLFLLSHLLVFWPIGSDPI